MHIRSHRSETNDPVKSCGHNATVFTLKIPRVASSFENETRRCSGVQRRRTQVRKTGFCMIRCVCLSKISATTSVRLDKKDGLHIYRLVEVLILHLRRSRSTPIRAQVHSVRRSMQDPHAPAEPARHDRHRDGDRDDAEPRKHPKPKLPPIHVERSAHRDWPIGQAGARPLYRFSGREDMEVTGVRDNLRVCLT